MLVIKKLSAYEHPARISIVIGACWYRDLVGSPPFSAVGKPIKNWRNFSYYLALSIPWRGNACKCKHSACQAPATISNSNAIANSARRYRHLLRSCPFCVFGMPLKNLARNLFFWTCYSIFLNWKCFQMQITVLTSIPQEFRILTLWKLGAMISRPPFRPLGKRSLEKLDKKHFSEPAIFSGETENTRKCKT